MWYAYMTVIIKMTKKLAVGLRCFTYLLMQLKHLFFVICSLLNWLSNSGLLSFKFVDEYVEFASHSLIPKLF